MVLAPKSSVNLSTALRYGEFNFLLTISPLLTGMTGRTTAISD